MPRHSTKLALAMSLALLPAAAMAERGTDGIVRLLYWQAPSILNPYLTAGTKDIEAASLILEPLAVFAPDGTLTPWLAQEIPTVANGGMSADLTSITWRLKEGLSWSDGTPVTAEDVAFTAAYCTAEGGGCSQGAKFEGVTGVEVLDPLTVRVQFDTPRPNPYTPFVGSLSPILQKAQFADCLGPRAPECTEANFAPIGTGPFRVTEFRPNDLVTYEVNPNYRDPAKPAFSGVLIKGGGDAMAAARTVFQTGEMDYAWNLLIAPDVLESLMDGSDAVAEVAFGPLVEHLDLNTTDPSPSLPEDIRSTREAPHPFLSDPAVRAALSMAIDRSTLAEVGYGPAGKPTCNLVPAPEIYASDNVACLPQDIDGARALLDEAGWVPGPDGVRSKDGVRLSILFQTSTNQVRQDFQSLIKSWWQEIGVETELRNIDASVYFGGDPGSPDTIQRFYADVEMFASGFDGTDPETYLARFACDKAPTPGNGWQGENLLRYCDPRFDELLDELSKTSEISARTGIAKELNDMLTADAQVLLPLVHRGVVSAHAASLGGVQVNPWDSELWNIADWYRIK